MDKKITIKYKKKSFLLIIFTFFLFLILFSGCKDARILLNDIEERNNLYQNQNTIQTEYNLEENIDTDIIPIFCPSNECLEAHINLFDSATNQIKCAFFEFDQHNLSIKLNNLSENGIDIELIVDNNYLEEEPLELLKQNENIKIYSDEPRTKLMHNKFCIIDEETLLVGSTNPTDNGFFKNNNNILIIKSKYLSKNYLEEFNEMKEGKYGGENKDSNTLYYNNITLINKNTQEEYRIATYFCPENSCEERIVTELKKATTSITFANFVLTSNEIEQTLIQKASENSNLEIIGLIENRMKNTRGSIINELNKSFPIHIDTNKGTMHHKVFIIDENTVITGSMNPSASGNQYNDENIIIIKNEKLAKLYKEEILSLIE